MGITQSVLEERFKWFHSHPELSFEEYDTTKRIKELLVDIGIEVLDLPLKTGLVAIIRGEKSGPTIALRTDIDALPITERTPLEYKSLHSNVMHACGHDFHLTSVYGAAIQLYENREELRGNVKIIFQPAEEIFSGAVHVMETGILDDVDAIFGLHANPSLPVGTVAIKEGNITAAVDRFQIILRGKGTHAAHPDQGIDPIIGTTQLVTALQSVISRNVNPFSTNLISVTHIKAGTTWNVIPEDAFVEGTVRTLDVADRQFIKNRIYELTENISQAFNLKSKINWIAGPPATKNDGALAEFATEIAQKSGLEVVKPADSLGGEDFAFYQEKIKGMFILVGTGESYPLHHPEFQVNPAALLTTSNLLARIGKEYLEKLTEKEE
ncbi:amidohydrolase [Streptococcus mitis]|uniref:amidohydrolase n=1 Tax=Streptococcus mitis TaxID=28037 RepID=UPI0021B61E38|nr:amidohydrolase [Streptococcus mitis]